MVQLGPGTLLAKVDIEHAYQNIPVNRDDRLLLGMRWKEKLYLDIALPLGLRLALTIFMGVADALELIVIKPGVSACMHYLEDFLTLGHAESDECKQNLDLIMRICEFLGVPLKSKKIEGLSAVFSGILLDTYRMEMRLPDEKVTGLGHLQQWESRQACRKRQLLLLIRKLAYATKVVQPGCIFLRRMIETAKKAKQLDHWIRLREEFHSDLAWWISFLEVWNDASFMSTHITAPHPDVTFSSDASGSWGCEELRCLRIMGM